MTKYFKVQHRDGATRIGKLLLKTQIQTPYILKIESLASLDSDIVYAKSLWRPLKLKEDRKKQVQEIRNKVGKNVLIIIPDLSFPPLVHGIENQRFSRTYTSTRNVYIEDLNSNYIKIIRA